MGGGRIPKEYQTMCHEWNIRHPDWQYTLWGNEAYRLLPKETQVRLSHNKNLGIASDVLRYQILHDYGGVYIDCDFVCVRQLDSLLVGADFLTSLTTHSPKAEVLTSFIASIPNIQFSVSYSKS